MPRTQITEFEKGRIFEAAQNGQSTRSIAKRFNRNQSTICRIIQKIKTRGHSHSLPRTGRPRSWTARHQRQIHRLVIQRPFWSYSRIQKVLRSPFSTATIRRILAPLGIKK